MKIAKPGIELVKSFESCMKKRSDGTFDAYMPTPNDVPTIGWGTTGKDIKMKMAPWTQQQCDDRFAADIGDFSKKVSDLLGTAKTTQNQFDAMVSLAYNIGTGAFGGSSVLKHHKAGNHAAAAAAFSLWVKQKGVVLKGLVRRRHAEAALYLQD
jgi:GH24 family phage-related lysozyme (muramidase)